MSGKFNNLCLGIELRRIFCVFVTVDCSLIRPVKEVGWVVGGREGCNISRIVVCILSIVVFLTGHKNQVTASKVFF